jgi:hypothetical protein
MGQLEITIINASITTGDLQYDGHLSCLCSPVTIFCNYYLKVLSEESVLYILSNQCWDTRRSRMGQDCKMPSYQLNSDHEFQSGRYRSEVKYILVTC